MYAIEVKIVQSHVIQSCVSQSLVAEDDITCNRMHLCNRASPCLLGLSKQLPSHNVTHIPPLKRGLFKVLSRPPFVPIGKWIWDSQQRRKFLKMNYFRNSPNSWISPWRKFMNLSSAHRHTDKQMINNQENFDPFLFLILFNKFDLDWRSPGTAWCTLCRPAFRYAACGLLVEAFHMILLWISNGFYGYYPPEMMKWSQWLLLGESITQRRFTVRLMRFTARFTTRLTTRSTTIFMLTFTVNDSHWLPYRHR